MEVTNENQEDTVLLTKGDLALASYALAETFNSFLAAYHEEDYGDATKEEMEQSMNKLRLAFIKFDSMLQSINKGEEEDNKIEQIMEGGNLGYGSFATTDNEEQGESDENQDEEAPS
tara:strand:+ start:52 stop:402 length:351 start_codon:yes stop_codon:yes gene_type:complete